MKEVVMEIGDIMLIEDMLILALDKLQDMEVMTQQLKQLKMELHQVRY